MAGAFLCFGGGSLQIHQRDALGILPEGFAGRCNLHVDDVLQLIIGPYDIAVRIIALRNSEA